MIDPILSFPWRSNSTTAPTDLTPPGTAPQASTLASTADADADAEAARLRAHTRAIRKARYQPSKLDRYRGELLQLHRAGLTPAQLQRWLRAKQIQAAWTTVQRWLQKNG